MKITTITIIFALVAVAEIVRTVIRVKREAIGIRSALVWLLMWAGIGFFSLFPGLLNAAMHLAQMENRMFFIMVVSLFILFAIIFNLNSRLDKIQRNVSKLVQEIAILNYKVEDLSGKGNPEKTDKSKNE